jgi:tripartite-type tricarboxylate transporter receptor subunit TctC
MPQPQFDRAAQDVGNIVGIGHVNVCIDDQHLVAQWDTPEEFRAFIAAETEKWGKVIKAAGIEPQ